MDFARNPAGTTVLRDWVETVDSSRGAPLWLLADTALLNGTRFRELISSLRWAVSNVLQGSLLEAFGAHAPHLVALPTETNSVIAGLERIVSLDPLSPAFSLIKSAASRTQLSRLTDYLAQARIDGDLLVHCRFADARVLPQLLQGLSVEQRSRVSVDITAWSWLDHLGTIQNWNAGDGATPDSAEPDSSPHLELDKSQFGAMLDASEPDTTFSLLMDNTPELVPSHGRGQFRDHLSQILARASMRCLVAPNDRLQFVILSLGCGDAFHDHRALQATWLAIAQRGATLVDEMKGWSDELWDQLQNRKPVIVE
jgi:Domain of unknown function (DUF4123)